MINVWVLTEKERKACTILSGMKHSDDKTFDKCKENDRIVKKAKKLLKGADPIQFAINVTTSIGFDRKEQEWLYRYYL